MSEPTSASEPLFARIVGRLHIPDAFLERYAGAVRAKFREAADKLGPDATGDDGINRCLHLASSVVLRNPEYLDDALAAIRTALSALVGTADPPHPPPPPTLPPPYYLLFRELEHLDRSAAGPEAAATRASFERIRQGFDKKDWLIGSDAMKMLGMHRSQI